jgi:prepilin-type N-terminal cleavage/methylation domain-containing protein
MLLSNQNKENGFTLVELLIAITIGLIVLGVLVSTFIIQRKTYDVQEQLAEMVQSARATMDIITREALMAGFNPSGAAFNGIPYSAGQLQILADLNGNGVTTDSNENIVYTFDGANLEIDRDTGGGALSLAKHVQAFSFSYLDSGGTATTITANIRQIQIAITARTAKPDPDYGTNGGYRTYTLTSCITPKNLSL